MYRKPPRKRGSYYILTVLFMCNAMPLFLPSAETVSPAAPSPSIQAGITTPENVSRSVSISR